ncbi:MAG: 30S ribosomal protein S6 [Patescibacteria group bacterium]
MDNIHDDRLSVYEIGYLIASSIPEEKVPGEADAIKKIITDAGSVIISEEAPYYQPLAYTMRKKMVSGLYEKYDAAYFGWIKFEVTSDKIEAIKNTVEIHPSIVRMLLITTVRENTFLNKRASAEALIKKSPEDGSAETKDAPVASAEEMDKSIEAMVKEA